MKTFKRYLEDLSSDVAAPDRLSQTDLEFRKKDKLINGISQLLQKATVEQLEQLVNHVYQLVVLGNK